MLAGLQLDRVLFVLVAQGLNLGMPEEGVVIEPHLGVERDKVAAAGDDQRVDLDQARIELGEGAIERVREIAERPHLSAGKPQPKRETPRIKGRQAGSRVDRHPQDLVGRTLRQLLDLDAALGGGDQRDPSGGAVDRQCQIELAGDVAARLDIDPLDLAPFGSGLVRHELFADQRLRRRRDLVLRAHQLDAAGLAAAAGMDLRLDDPNASADAPRHPDRLVRGIGDAPLRHRHAEFREQLLRLVFVDVHGARLTSPPASRASCGRCR